MDKRTKIAVVTGGKAAELEVSLKSAKVVINSLSKEKYDVYKVDISTMPWIATKGEEHFPVDLNDFSIQNNTCKFDFAFLAIHGTPAEDGKIQGYFELINVPYSASSVLASAITFDKDITKQLVKQFDVKLAKSVLLTSEQADYEKLTNHLARFKSSSSKCIQI